MTRQECEAKLLELAEQMRAVYMEYNPSGDFLSMISDVDGYINVDDSYFNAERKIVEDVNGNVFRTVDVTKYKDGSIRMWNKRITPEGAA